MAVGGTYTPLSIEPTCDVRLHRPAKEGGSVTKWVNGHQAASSWVSLLTETPSTRRRFANSTPSRSPQTSSYSWDETLGGKEDRFLDFILGVRNHGRSCCIAPDIGHGSGHIQDPVHSPDQRGVLKGQMDGL